MRKSFSALLIALLFIPFTSVKADEGMWLLPLLAKQNGKIMYEMGLEMNVGGIYSEVSPSLKDAIVIFGNGCTGEVVSPNGLILTNHHCGYGAIQQHSTVEHDYLRDGFVAKSYEEEIPTPGLTVTFLVKMEDVTEKVLEGISDNDEEYSRLQKIRVNRQEIAEAATEGTHYLAQVGSFYAGNKYYLCVYERFTDVRMVLAPPSSIGKFGGDTDNWQYPRHTGDFSMFRVYADANNKPADYSPDNKPYRPKRFLNISIDGYKEGDFAMIMGYPGSTERYMTSWEVAQRMAHENAPRAHVRGIKQGVWQEHMQADQAIRIKYSSKYALSSNYWKNSIGQNEAFQKLGTVKQKEREEQAFRQWVNADDARYVKYGRALELIQGAVNATDQVVGTRTFLVESLLQGIEVTLLASRVGRVEQWLESKDKEQLDAYRQEVLPGLEESFFKDYDLATDRATAKAMITLFRKERSQDEQPAAFKIIDTKFKGNVEKYVDWLYAESIFTGFEKLSGAFPKLTAKKLRNDPVYSLMLSIQERVVELNKQLIEPMQELLKGQRLYVAGRLEMLGDKPSYPDANFTMRLTYGTVKGYSPRDAVSYNHYTTLDGVMQKEQPEKWEFIVPARLKELHRLQDYDRYAMPDGVMPVNFLTTNDITGGNSGSPVLNARGELIGLAFDGNWESLSGDIAFEPELQRCINVDIRYVLFIIQQWGGATRLIDEMSIKQAPPQEEQNAVGKAA